MKMQEIGKENKNNMPAIRPITQEMKTIFLCNCCLYFKNFFSLSCLIAVAGEKEYELGKEKIVRNETKCRKWH